MQIKYERMKMAAQYLKYYIGMQKAGDTNE